MIAVIHPSRSSPGAMPDDLRTFAEGAVAEARKRDGCEACISVRDPATGESVTLNLFRDQAALEAFQAFENEKIAEAEALGVPVDPGRVYTEVIAGI
jgi:hypothetical protein